MDLIVQQQELQDKAREVLDDLDLLNLLKTAGEPYLVGSAQLGLMAWRDIDLEIIVEELEKKKVAEVAKRLILNTTYRLDVSFSDNIARFNNANPHSPQSLYLGLLYFGHDIEPSRMQGSNPLAWKLDLHFILEKDARSLSKTEELESKITEEKRRTILEIKDKISSNPKYRKEIFSMDIYEAVLDNDVKDLEDFKIYLQESGRSL
jgi:hypothetical protein